jgi:hypothetical protein
MCQGSSKLLSANNGTGLKYQWKKGNVNIVGATNLTYKATTGGEYKVIVTNINTGCSKTSPSTTINITCKEMGVENESVSFTVYPNPTSNEFTFSMTDGADYDVIIYDLVGKKVATLSKVSNGLQFGSELKSGVYLAQVMKDNNILIQTIKLIKVQ